MFTFWQWKGKSEIRNSKCEMRTALQLSNGNVWQRRYAALEAHTYTPLAILMNKRINELSPAIAINELQL